LQRNKKDHTAFHKQLPMSLNDIRLHSSLLASLYPSTLIETAISGTAATAVPEPSPPKFLGKGAKGIALVVRNAELPFLADSELTFLTNVLAACKLSLADVAIVNVHGMEAEGIEKMLARLDARTVVLFGMQPLEIGLPINFPTFQVQPFSGRKYLHCPLLGTMEGDKGLKMQLWNALKTLFGL
jgi:hypothetical protein